MNQHLTARDKGLVACRCCTLVCSGSLLSDAYPECPRCGATLQYRRPHALLESWAFLLAAIALYAPAILLPVLDTRSFGKSMPSTLLDGIRELWQHGSYGIAIVIFVASVLVPCGKFLVLGVLLITSQRGSRRARSLRTKAYRFVSLIGYWSMLDVLVIAVVSALLKFGALGEVVPRVGILCFGLVVMLTMLASMRFDPRLIWDEKLPRRSPGGGTFLEKIRRLPICLLLGVIGGTLPWIYYDRPFESSSSSFNVVASGEPR
ncbi:paraquat-inducible protein A [Achromobacter aloeverae]